MRIVSIDFFRFIAVFSVIIIHTKPFMRDLFPDSSYRMAEYIFNQPPRFAVPFFFITAGYFLAKKYAGCSGAEQRAICARYVGRLLLLLAAWSILYTVIPSDWPTMLEVGYQQHTLNKIRQVLVSPLLLLFEGTKVHLWFLSSLSLGVVLLTFFIGIGRPGLLIFFSVLLFAVGLFAGSYSVTPLGLNLPFISRDGPFLSTICLGLGFLIYQRRQARLSAAQAFLFISSGLALHVGETWALWKYYATPMLNHDYLIGTVICSVGVLLLALAAPDIGRSGKLYTLGECTFGVYLCHYFFVDALGPLTYLFELHIWQFLFPFLVFLLSQAMALMLTRWSWSKALVT